MKQLLKRVVKSLPIAITKNQKYDRETLAVLKKVCQLNSNCIDVGCHNGEIMDIILKLSPLGNHFGFEPLPDFYEKLRLKYVNRNCHIYNVALANKVGEATFNYVVSNPAYSGLMKRKYDRVNEKDTTINVNVDLLDNIIPNKLDISFIKIDVEGAEMGVLMGATQLIDRCKPIIIFEHGLGASDVYGTKPQDVFSFFKEKGYQVSTMCKWLKAEPSFDLEAFKYQFNEGLNYYFIAYPYKN